ncbi:MAG: NmrA family NAD(P)-binding protein [Chitinophagaceae bacterium]
MKYVITGSIGNISKPITEALVKAGHDVTVVTSSAGRTKEIEALGAKAAVGSIEDQAFLNKTFAGADVVYTMVPPKWDAKDWKGYIGKIGENYAAAIKQNNIKYVVNLSSQGAHMPEGCGPVSGLYRVEQALDKLTDVNIKHLRPAYFYNNLFSNLGLIKNLGIIGANYSTTGKTFVIVDPSDIAAVAIEALLNKNFSGHSVVYIASDEVSTNEIAATIGKAIGKPELPWVEFSDEQSLQGGIQAGLTEEVSSNYAEMGRALRTGAMAEDYWKHKPALGKVKLADFAKKFAAVYNSSESVAAH